VAQRFAIAHEIAHHVLRHDGERSKIEPEANAFASELLIPRTELMEAIASNRSATALRTHFGVSRDAMVYALVGARAINKVIH
jgi:Zn-dependent peptidase ImmA (M78 family)